MTLAPLGLLYFAVLTDRGDLAISTGVWAALSCIFVLSLSSAIFQASIYGLAGMADPKLSASIMMGQGIAGIVTGAESLLQPCMTTFIILILTSSALTALAQLVYLTQLRSHQLLSPMLEQMALDRRRTSIHSMPAGTPMSPDTAASPRRQGRKITQDVLPQALGVFTVFMTTFVVFPGVVDTWTGGFGMSGTRFDTLMIGEFQLLDVAGRVVAGWVRRPSGKAVVTASIMRTLLVPLFIGAQRLPDSPLGNAWFRVALMFVFAFSNGLVATLGMMLGPQQVCIKEEKETAGHIMSFSVVFGILVGSVLALLTQLNL